MPVEVSNSDDSGRRIYRRRGILRRDVWRKDPPVPCGTLAACVAAESDWRMFMK